MTGPGGGGPCMRPGLPGGLVATRLMGSCFICTGAPQFQKAVLPHAMLLLHRATQYNDKSTLTLSCNYDYRNILILILHITIKRWLFNTLPRNTVY